MIPNRDEVYRSALTSYGFYPIFIAPKNAFRAGWRYLKRGKRFEPIDIALEEYLDELYVKYHMREKCTLAAQMCRLWTRCLFYPRQVASRGEKRRYEVMIIPLFEEDIEYTDDRSSIRQYKPIVRLGDKPRQLFIPPHKAVLWRNGDDPFGSQYDGQSTLLPIYKTIARGENIIDSVAGIIQRRGNGYLIFSMEGANEEALEKMRQVYGNPSQYSVIFVNERSKVESVSAMSQGFRFGETMDVIGKELSRGSSLPAQRMTGDPSVLASAETTQDAQAEAYSVIQEDFERYIIDSFHLLDTLEQKWGLEDYNFQIDFETEVRMDPQRRANILTTFATGIGAANTLITVNQALYLLHFPLIRGEDGNMILAEWNQQFSAAVVEEGHTNKEGEEKGAPADPAAYEMRELKKQAVADSLRRQGISYRRTNAVLKQLFGAGISNTKLVKE